MVPLPYVLGLGALLFSLGLYGALTQRNAVRILMCIEIMLNSVNLNLIGFARYLEPNRPGGQLFAIFVMTVAAAEAAIGLAIILVIAHRRADIDIDKINLLKW